ncbi:MAG TPA: putative Ig domain-containing protein [Chthoniobacterales bacterium]
MPPRNFRVPRRLLRKEILFLAAGGFILTAQAGTPPSNDSFADRTNLSGRSVVVSTYNTYSTTEPGEPSIGKLIATKSLWWSWTAPYTGLANFSTYGSGSPLALGVFLGNSLKSLSTVGISNATPWTLRYYSSYPFYYSYQRMNGDAVNVPVRSGETYQILVAEPVFASDTADSTNHVVLGINQAPAILSAGSVNGALSQSLSYQINASHAPASYSAQGLPPGLSLDAYTGLISGTPTATGVFDATISATNPGGTGSAIVRFEIAKADTTARAPELAWGYAVADGTVGQSFSYSSISAKNTPTEFTTDSLPPGLTWYVSSLGSATASAYPSGTPTQAGIFKTTVRAANAVGSAEAYVTYRIREKPPVPVLQSAAAAYGKVRTSFSYSLYGSNMTDGTYECGTLPAGLQMSTLGSISGTPTEAGTFEIPVKVTNAAGSTTGTLTLNIAAADAAPPPVKAPVITSPAGASGNVGTSFYYATNANTPGAQYTASGLPDGLTINPTTGVISGSPKASGNYTATITASNELGTSTTTLTLSIGIQSLFGLSSPTMAKGVVGKSFSYQLMAGTPSYPGPSYSSSSFKTTVPTAALPPGLSYTPSSYQSYPYYNFLGTITGRPTTPGIYRVPVTTVYQNLTAQAVLTIVVSETVTQPPIITSSASAQGKVGQSFSYSTSVSNYAGSYAASGLPAGLSINASTGAISGTPTQTGTYVVDLSATNAVGTSHAKLTIFIGPTPTGTFYSNTAYEGTVGISLSIWISYSNPTSDTPTYAAEDLPPGLQLSATGYISGTPTTAGTYPVTISATNAGGTTSIVQTFLIHAAPKPPVLTSDLMATGNVGASFSYSPYTSSAGSVTYEFGQMPPGLTVSNGWISGKPTQSGTYEIPIIAANAGGSTSGVLTLKIGPPVPPSLSTTVSALAPRGQNFSKSFYPSNTTSASVSGTLPAGITFNAQNFQLSGTPTENGVFPLEIILNGPGGTITVPFTLYVTPPPLPVVTSSLIANFSSSTYSYFYADNYPTAFSAQGLPTGLTFSNESSYAYAYKSGGFASQGLVPATITATNFTGSSSAVVHFTSNSNLQYDFGKAMAEGIVGEAFSYTLYSGSNTFMTGRAYFATNLPPGLAIDSTTGKITGTPTTAGTYAVNITATHSSYVSLSFTLMIRVKATPELLVITSNNVITATPGQSISYWIETSGKATSYALTPIPPGLTFDSTTGKLSGTPTTAGEYKVQVSATNAAGTRSANVLVRIATTPAAPIFYSDLSLQGSVGDSFSSYLSASDSPTSYAASGLPPGITLKTSTGELSGTPTAAGTYLAQVQAVNAGGTTTAKLAFVVLEQQTPIISTDTEQIGTVGDSFSCTLSALHTPTSFTASNLPPGLSLDSAIGKISGTPTQAGDYLVPVMASNATASGAATLTLRIQPRVPGWLSSAAAAQGLVGEKLSISLYASQSNSTFSAENLPDGLSLSSAGTTITGIPTVAGQYEIPVHVKRGDTETTSILSLTIAATPTAPPTITSALTAFVGSGYSYTLSTTNLPTSLGVENLPTGVTFDPTTGVISGTPKTSGATDITITADNAIGQSTATVRLVTIAPPTSIVTTNANIYATASMAFAYPIALSTEVYDPFSYYYYPPYFPYSGPTALPPTITARGLPPGMFFNPLTQQIEGTATAAGDYSVELTASTALAETTTHITLHVSESPSAPSSTLQVSSGLDLDTFGAVGSTFSLNIFPVGLATELVSTELPPGIVLSKEYGISNGFRTLIGKLSGSPTKSGVYPVKFTFSNAEQSASAIVTIVIPEVPELPVFSGAVAASGTVGKNFSYYIGDGSGYLLNNAATAYGLADAPPGLKFDLQSHQITGTPTQHGTFFVPVSLTNAGGTTEATLTISIASEEPAIPQIIGSSGTLQAGEVGYIGETFTLSLKADSPLADLTISNLPAGLILQKKADGFWTLTGTPTKIGTSHLLLTATNAAGTSTIPLTLNVRSLDESTPLPPPEPSPASTPKPIDSTPPSLVVQSPSLVLTKKSSLLVRGRVLHRKSGITVTARWVNTLPWRKIRVSPSGKFSVLVSPLPKGLCILTIRLENSSGRKSVKKIKIYRS